MVGRLADPHRVPGIAFRQEGHAVALIGPFAPEFAGSELEKLRGGLADGLRRVELERQAIALAFVREVARSGELASAHDVSDGGLACALAECAIAGSLGARLDLTQLPASSPEEALFGEGPGGVVVSGPAPVIERLRASPTGVEVVPLGWVGGTDLVVTAGSASFELSVHESRAVYERAIPDQLR